VLLLNVWAKALFFLPYALATNLFSAVCTTVAAFVSARIVQRVLGVGSEQMAWAAALCAGGMTSVWLNATETEVYAASLALGLLMVAAGERAGRGEDGSDRWTMLCAYLIALSVPLHLSALVAAPAAIALAALDLRERHVDWRRIAFLGGAMLFAMGVGRMSRWMGGAGAVLVILSAFAPTASTSSSRGLGMAVGGASVALIAMTALAFLYVRAGYDPAVNQGDPSSWQAFTDAVARRQYAVSPMWPREAPVWLQLANLGQYADWQTALSLGPNVLPSIGRTAFTVMFLVLGFHGAREHWRNDGRTFMGLLVLFLCGTLGVVAYLNMHAGPSIGWGILPDNAVREARERDYFYVFGFWVWGLWAGVGAITFVRRVHKPVGWGIAIASLPFVLNWHAVTRRAMPERVLPRVTATAMLEATPPNGVLFVMGDNDSYPLWYAQEVRRVRPDVAVITIPLLPTDWYRAQIATRFGLLTPDEARRYDGKLETASRIADGARRLRRPIAASMMLTAGERARLARGWRAGGLSYVATDSAVRVTPRDSSRVIIDSAATARWAAWIDERTPHARARDAIDPVHAYFQRMLDCPRQLGERATRGDSLRLDSVCNYR